MSYLFSASGDLIDFGNPSGLTNKTAQTVAVWLYNTSGNAEEGRVFQKSANNRFEWRNDTTRLVLIRNGTSQCRAEALLSNFSAYAANKWLYVVAQFNFGGSTTDQKIFIGDLSTPAAEPSAYVSQTAGSGSVTSDSASNLLIGNNTSAGTLEFNGRIAIVQAWDALLTSRQIWAQQFGFVPVATQNLQLFSHLGLNNIAGCPDWSGNRQNGSVTGATVAAHVPLPKRPNSRNLIMDAVVASSSRVPRGINFRQNRIHPAYLQ